MARILLAEDDVALREVVARALTGDGHTVVAVQDGLEAADKLAESGPPFDILLTDIDMPGLDGVSLATRAIAQQPALRILLMTAFADMVAVPPAVQARVARVLTKPISLDTLRGAVKSAMA